MEIEAIAKWTKTIFHSGLGRLEFCLDSRSDKQGQITENDTQSSSFFLFTQKQTFKSFILYMRICIY